MGPAEVRWYDLVTEVQPYWLQCDACVFDATKLQSKEWPTDEQISSFRTFSCGPTTNIQEVLIMARTSAECCVFRCPRESHRDNGQPSVSTAPTYESMDTKAVAFPGSVGCKMLELQPDRRFRGAQRRLQADEGEGLRRKICMGILSRAP